MDRLLQQKDVIRAIDEHTTADGKLDNDITCILENIRAALIDDIGIPLEPPKKEKRIQLFENDNIILEQRGNKYYLSLYDTIGRFKKEVTIDMKDDILEILSREDCYENI